MDAGKLASDPGQSSHLTCAMIRRCVKLGKGGWFESVAAMGELIAAQVAQRLSDLLWQFELAAAEVEAIGGGASGGEDFGVESIDDEAAVFFGFDELFAF